MLTTIGKTGREAWNHIALDLFFNIFIICITYYLTIASAYRLTFKKNKYLLAVVSLIVCMIVFSQLLYLGFRGSIFLAKALGMKINSGGLPFGEAILKWGYKGVFTSILAWSQILISYFLLMGPPITGRFFRDQLRLQHHKNVLEKENLKLEMDFLKAQIHPHFLFNTLNNIYSLISHQETGKSAAMVSGLSSLLRYALYDGKAEFIPLEKEVMMLKDFIALEEVRSDDTKLDIDFPDEIPALKIPPFLLLPLVENAFKHGVNSQLEQSAVMIQLSISQKEITLVVHNSFDADYRKKNSGGLGLLNLEKRLDYYYHKKYFLQTEEEQNLFTAQLKLPLICPQLNA